MKIEPGIDIKVEVEDPILYNNKLLKNCKVILRTLNSIITDLPPINFSSKYSSIRNLNCFVCNYCYYITSCESKFEKHKIIHEDKKIHKNKKIEKIYMCKLCSHSTNSRTTFVVHTRVHTKEKPFCCDICDFKTSHNSTLIYHKKKHENVIKKRYKCIHCHFTSHRNYHLLRHLKTHNQERRFKCDQCSDDFIRREHLEGHLKSKKHKKIKKRSIKVEKEKERKRERPIKDVKESDSE